MEPKTLPSVERAHCAGNEAGQNLDHIQSVQGRMLRIQRLSKNHEIELPWNKGAGTGLLRSRALQGGLVVSMDALFCSALA